MAIYTSTHTGLEIDTAIDTVDDLVGQVQIVIASAGYQIVGDFSDVTKVEITLENQVYSSKSILGYESALWRPIIALPYTPTGTDPTPGGDEAGNWVAVSVGELETIARSLNTNNNNVMYDTDEVTPIVGYIYSKSQQVIYSVPADAVGKIISSVVGSTLTTTEPASYQLESINKSDLRMTLAEAVASTKVLIGDSLVITDRGDSVWDVVPVGAIQYVNLPDSFGVIAHSTSLSFVLSLRVNDAYIADHFGAKGDCVIDANGDAAIGYTPNANVFNYMTTRMGRYATEIKLSKGNYEITGWKNNSVNLIVSGIGNQVSQLIGLGAGVTFENQPLLNGFAYGAKGSSGLFLSNCRLYAGDEDARLLGTGIRMIDSYVTEFDKTSVIGFKYNISLFGCHYNKFEQCYNANEKRTLANPDADSHNRGYAIVTEPGTSPAGQPVSTGIKIDGGWYSNTSFDFTNMANGIITNIDIEPANDSVLIGSRFSIYDNRFERMDLFALPPYEFYPRFSWFIFDGDDNVFKNNNIHTTGANSQSFVNPKVKVEGDRNTFEFAHYTITSGLIDFNPLSHGNSVEIGIFKDWEFFGPAVFPSYHAESNCGIFEGSLNNYKLKQNNSSISVVGREIKVSGMNQSIAMPNSPLIQGATGSAGTYTLDGTGNNRLILNFSSTDVYSEGYHAIKFRIVSNGGMTFTIRPEYLKEFNAGESGTSAKTDQFMVWRFYIPADQTGITIQPAILFSGSIGQVFTINDIEVLKLDSGEYTENNYILP